MCLLGDNIGRCELLALDLIIIIIIITDIYPKSVDLSLLPVFAEMIWLAFSFW